MAKKYKTMISILSMEYIFNMLSGLSYFRDIQTVSVQCRAVSDEEDTVGEFDQAGDSDCESRREISNKASFSRAG